MSFENEISKNVRNYILKFTKKMNLNKKLKNNTIQFIFLKYLLKSKILTNY